MREQMLKAIKTHAQGHIDKHVVNVEIYLERGVGVAEHPDVIDSIEKELEEIAKYDDQLAMLEKYFNG